MTAAKPRARQKPCRHPKAARKKSMAMFPMVDALGFNLRWTEVCSACRGRRPLGTRGRFWLPTAKGAKGRRPLSGADLAKRHGFAPLSESEFKRNVEREGEGSEAAMSERQRRRYAIVDDGNGPERRMITQYEGVDGVEFRWTQECTGCYEPGECMGMSHLYPYDKKAQCRVGAGCDECGYTGKRRASWWVSLVDLKRVASAPWAPPATAAASQAPPSAGRATTARDRRLGAGVSAGGE